MYFREINIANKYKYWKQIWIHDGCFYILENDQFVYLKNNLFHQEPVLEGRQLVRVWNVFFLVCFLGAWICLSALLLTLWPTPQPTQPRCQSTAASSPSACSGSTVCFPPACPHPANLPSASVSDRNGCCCVARCFAFHWLSLCSSLPSFLSAPASPRPPQGLSSASCGF